MNDTREILAQVVSATLAGAQSVDVRHPFSSGFMSTEMRSNVTSANVNFHGHYIVTDDTVSLFF